ncbi:hypothetical protein OG607_33010 [Streptomyces sp. NBC_01537]|uniref:hypothetical protein n=1 Tax=Streptomyces sp. NBC_01537 TaxID=2903896 RepID=UPI00386EFEFE
MDDLAVTLRSLIASGRGNSILQTTCRNFKTAQPELQISRPPAHGSTYFSVGSIPVEEPGAVAHGARTVTFSKWTQEPVLRFATKSGTMTYSWDKFIREYANKWGGAHLDASVPDELWVVERHAAAGLVLSNYLLRTAGVAVWNMAQETLRAVLPSSPSNSCPPEDYARRAYQAPGSTSPAPEHRRELGQIQWLSLSKSNMDFGWYVDGYSSKNSLRLSFGAIPYDVHYRPQREDEAIGQVLDPAFVSPSPQGPRHEATPARVQIEEMRTGQATGIILPIQVLNHDPSNPPSVT